MEICREQTTRTDSGGVGHVVEPVVAVWAEVLWNRGGERWSGQQIAAEAEVMFRIRYRPFVTPVVLIRYEGRLFDVYSAPEVGRRDVLELFAKGRAETDARPV